LALFSITSTSVSVISPSPSLWIAPEDAQATFLRKSVLVTAILLRRPTALTEPSL
jgi:hypothetical protein